MGVPKLNRPKKVILTALVVTVAGFGYLFTVDRNPVIPYNALDGMAMTREYITLIRREHNEPDEFISQDLNEIKTPLDFAHRLPKNREAKIAIVFVNYETAPFLEKASTFFKRHYVLETGAREFFYAISSTGIRETMKPRYYSGLGPGLHTIDLKISLEGYYQAMSLLSNMPENGHIQLHSSFCVIQFGKEVRVYPATAMPAPIREALKHCAWDMGF